MNKDTTIEIGKVSLRYELDTKRYCQPVHVFDVKINDEKMDISIPAVKC